jgi:hypothetical protein
MGSKEIAELKRQLAEAERHIIGGHDRINRQRQLIGSLRAAGRNTIMARRILARFEEMQKFFRSYRDELTGLLARTPDHTTDLRWLVGTSENRTRKRGTAPMSVVGQDS